MSYDLDCIKKHVEDDDKLKESGNYNHLTTKEELMINHLSRVVIDLERRIKNMESVVWV